MGTSRDESFAVEGGVLIRRVTPRRGEPYQHTCTEQVYKDAAYAVEQLGSESFTGEELQERLDAPTTQVFTALAFLKERGCIVPAHGRRHAAASDFVYEDALIEWHALRENGPADAAFGYE
jgi:hypothetical protein